MIRRFLFPLVVTVHSSRTTVNILSALGRSPYASPEQLMGILDNQEISLDEVRQVRDQVGFYSVVPEWFHTNLVVLSSYADNIDFVVDLMLMNSLGSLSDYPRSEIQLRIERWFRHCVFPSMNWPDVCAPRIADDAWQLSEQALIRLIHEMILLEVDSVKRNPPTTSSTTSEPNYYIPIQNQILRAFENNNQLTALEVSRMYNMELARAEQLRAKVFRPFTQPAWFLQFLVRFEGEKKFQNKTLLDAIREKSVYQTVRARGDMREAVRAWLQLCVIPLEKNPSMDPLPYTYETIDVDGNLVQMVSIRPDLLQEYLRTRFVYQANASFK